MPHLAYRCSVRRRGTLTSACKCTAALLPDPAFTCTCTPLQNNYNSNHLASRRVLPVRTGTPHAHSTRQHRLSRAGRGLSTTPCPHDPRSCLFLQKLQTHCSTPGDTLHARYLVSRNCVPPFLLPPPGCLVPRLGPYRAGAAAAGRQARHPRQGAAEVAGRVNGLRVNGVAMYFPGRPNPIPTCGRGARDEWVRKCGTVASKML